MTISKIHEYWLRCGIRWEHIDATFESYDRSAPDAAKAHAAMLNFWEGGNGVCAILSGSYGTGKSHLAAATIKAAESGVFITSSELLTLQRDLPFNAESGGVSRGDMVATLRECPVLVLDEIGVSSGGVDENALIDDVLGFRIDRQLPTVLTTNVGLDKIGAFLGGRVMDRVLACAATIPPVVGSRRAKRSIVRREDIPKFGFSGRLPDHGEYFDPAGWREFLAGIKRPYEAYRYAPGFLKGQFGKKP